MIISSSISKEAEEERVLRLLDEADKDLDSGRLPLSIIADPGIFELEVEKLWYRSWNFLAHESEIPALGDYVLRNIGPYDSIIVVRNKEGIQAFANICSHRGMKVCRADMGNTSHFRCPYHGWTYDLNGLLIGVPFKEKMYKDYPVIEKHSFLSIRTETRGGMIFGTLSEDAEPLDRFFGNFKWYFDMFCDRTEKGLEFYPAVSQVATLNWKIDAENTATDFYHVATTHRANLELGALRPVKFESDRVYGIQTCINGHAMNYQFKRKDAKGYVGSQMSWPEFPELLRKRLDEKQIEILTNTHHMFSTIFPNLSITSRIPGIEFRLLRPISPLKTEIVFWNAIDKEAPIDLKKALREEFLRYVGMSGIQHQDDNEMFKQITLNSMSLSARKMKLNYDAGINSRKHIEGYGPGELVTEVPNEINAVRMWKEYLKYLRS